MSYFLGIDLGTTYTAAAVWRDGRVEVASLGNRSPVIPSVVFLKDDESILTGEAASRRGATEPGRVAREFKRRLGDPTPIMVGGTPYSADALMAKLLRWVVAEVTQREGAPPDGIAVCHPANWGPFKTDLLTQAIARADLDGVAVLTEPEAAAIHYASHARVEPGSVVAVYDLGGGTFDAAVLRKSPGGWEILGDPQGIERLGGVDFDEAVFQHVLTVTGLSVDDLDAGDPTTLAALSRLRQECIEAKEALSSDTDASIPVLLPSLQTEVRITRQEFEHMIRPTLSDSIVALQRALRSASVTPEQVDAVLLVGGSSRVPLVAQLVSTELGRPVAVDAHPKHAIPLGAAIFAADAAGAGTPPAAATAPTDAPTDAEADGAHTATTTAAPLVGVPLVAGLGTGTQVEDTPEDIAPAVAAAAAAAEAGEPPLPGPVERFEPPTVAEQAVSSHAPPTLPVPSAVEPPSGPAPAGIGAPAAASTPPPEGQAAASEPPPGAPSAPPPGTPQGGVGGPSPATPSGGGDGGEPPSGYPDPPDDDGGPAKRRAGVLVGAAIAVVVAVIVGVALAGGGDDPPEEASTDETSEDTSEDTTEDTSEDTSEDTTEETFEESSEETPYVEILDVQMVDDRYEVTYQLYGFEPSFEGGQKHIHLFFDTTPSENAGNNAETVGTWVITDEPQTYLTEYTPDSHEREGAYQMCSAVADEHHNLIDLENETGDCYDLPDNE